MWSFVDTVYLMGPGAVTVRIRPGPASTASSRDRTRQLQELRRTELTRVRTAAENWRNGLAALLALITTVSVVKGRAAIDQLPFRAQVAVGVALLAAVICAAAGAYLAMRAAYGMPTIQQLSGSTEELVDFERASAVKAMGELRWAVRLTFATLALLVTAIGVTWYVPPSPPAMVQIVTRDGASVCGTLQHASATDISVEHGGQVSGVPTSALGMLRVVRGC